jgi:hypothetical protein
VLAGLDGVLLGRQAKRVEAERVQDKVALHPPVARADVGGDVAQRVPDMQPGPGRVREHVHDVELAPRVERCSVRQVARRIRRLEGVLLGPDPLPFGLDLSSAFRVVSEVHDVPPRRPMGWVAARSRAGDRSRPARLAKEQLAEAHVVRLAHAPLGTNLNIASTALTVLTPCQ